LDTDRELTAFVPFIGLFDGSLHEPFSELSSAADS
jgi:hypothetical protein